MFLNYLFCNHISNKDFLNKATKEIEEIAFELDCLRGKATNNPSREEKLKIYSKLKEEFAWKDHKNYADLIFKDFSNIVKIRFILMPLDTSDPLYQLTMLFMSLSAFEDILDEEGNDIIALVNVETEKFVDKKEDYLERYSTYYALFKAIKSSDLLNNKDFVYLAFSTEQDVEFKDLLNEKYKTNENLIINRSIEFPPELYQAGLGILSYFSTYLEDNYSNTNACVKIEQEDKIIRLIVTTENGEFDIIEQAFKEYSLIVSEKRNPEEFIKNEKSLMEMRFKLDQKNSEIRLQTQLLDYERRRSSGLEKRIYKLEEQIDRFNEKVLSLSTKETNVYNTFNSQQSSVNNNILTQQISQKLNKIEKYLHELKDAATTPEQKNDVEEVTKAVREVKQNPTQEAVKKKGIITKIKGLSENITKGMGAFTKTADATDKAAKSAQKLIDIGEKLIPYADQLMQAIGG